MQLSDENDLKNLELGKHKIRPNQKFVKNEKEINELRQKFTAGKIQKNQF